MILVILRFTHYSPKDSESGIKELIIADSLDKIVAYIDREHLYGYLAEEVLEEGSFSQIDEWWKANPTKRAEALKAGLKIDEYGDVTGDARVLTRWLEGTVWQEISDAHYGVTQWDWSESKEVSLANVAILSTLGLARIL